jgi:hypothetical protein
LDEATDMALAAGDAILTLAAIYAPRGFEIPKLTGWLAVVTQAGSASSDGFPQDFRDSDGEAF